jgi:tRNA dimethylallyltransferase
MASKIILIVGPTASGKTKLSIEIAKKYNAEIINADSRYLYKEPIIATAKVTLEEMDNIKHHMIDIISLNDDYSIFNYQKEGRKILDDLISQNKNIVIVGGSGLYIKALLYDYKLDETKKANIDFNSFSNEELKNKINDIDSSNNIHINNRKRMERYLSYYYENGNTITKTDSINKKLYNFISIGLIPDKEELYNYINNRVDVMFNNGLLNESNNLKEYKHFKDVIGYREFIDYFDDKIPLEEVKNNIKKDSRHLAKRQLTWFKNQMKDIIWFNVDYSNFNNTINDILNYLKEN